MGDQRRNAIITGAASGLGRALAVRLATEGWQVALADIDSHGATETKKLVRSAGGEGRTEHVDVTRIDDWVSLRERLTADWSHLDLLVNNAGVSSCGDVGTFPPEDWQWVLNINLYGGIYGCHTMVDWLKSNPSGSHIINMASLAAIAPSPAMGAYNVAKAGILSLSETLYVELKPHGVGVTVVCPAFFHSNILGKGRHHSEHLVRFFEESTKNATLTAEEVADAAIRAMRRRKLYAIPGRQSQWHWFLRRLMPTGFLDGTSKVFDKMRLEHELNRDNEPSQVSEK